MTSFFSLDYFENIWNFFNSSPNNEEEITNYPRKTVPGRMKKTPNIKTITSFLTCINCGNFIDESLIETHSNKCISISHEVTTMNDNELKASNFKLEKLKEHLNDLIKRENNYYINVIIIYIAELLSNNEPTDNRAKIKKMIKNINSLTKTYKGSFHIQVYLDRFKVLLNNRLSIYKNNKHNAQRESVSKQSSKSYDPIEKISNINSINESASISSINDMTNMSGSDHNDDTEASNKEKQIKNNEINIMNTADMYKAFSQKMLKIKFEKFNHNSFIQKIQCKLLFVECMNQQIPYSKWNDFIVKEMSYNCLKYIKRTRKIAIKKMDTICEEDF